MVNRFLGMDAVAEWIEECDAVCISVEYRLAPENPDPAPLEDCCTGLKWVGNNLETLGIDLEKLMIAGQSAGGGLAAGVALLVRDKGDPKLCAQCLCYPMLDDRNTTISSHQYAKDGSWNRQKNLTGWSCLLGERAGGSEVNFYTAPGRATDLSEPHLPLLMLHQQRYSEMKMLHMQRFCGLLEFRLNCMSGQVDSMNLIC